MEASTTSLEIINYVDVPYNNMFCTCAWHVLYKTLEAVVWTKKWYSLTFPIVTYDLHNIDMHMYVRFCKG